MNQVSNKQFVGKGITRVATPSARRLKGLIRSEMAGKRTNYAIGFVQPASSNAGEIEVAQQRKTRPVLCPRNVECCQSPMVDQLEPRKGLTCQIRQRA